MSKAELCDQLAASMKAFHAGLEAAQKGFEFVQEALEQMAEEDRRSESDSNGQPQVWLTTDEMAKLLKIAPNTLRRLRSDGKGPYAEKFGGAVRYLKPAPPKEENAD